MKRLLVATLFVAVGAASFAANVDPGYITATIYLPYQFDLSYDATSVVTSLQNQGRTSDVWRNTSGDGVPTDCTVEKFDYVLRNASERGGVFVVNSHGSESGSTVEAFRLLQDREDRWNYYMDHGWSGKLAKSAVDETNGPWGIRMKNSTISAKFQRDTDNLIAWIACSSCDWAPGTFTGVRCVVCAWDPDFSQTDQVDALFCALNGSGTPAQRAVEGALQSLTALHYSGDGATNLSPIVLGVDPWPNEYFDGVAEVTILFDSVMDTSRDPLEAAENGILQYGTWEDDQTYRCQLTAIDAGDVRLTTTTGARGRNTTPLDGDRCGPNGDAFAWTLTSTFPGVNIATSYAFCTAWRESTATHVAWITDPEEGSSAFQVRAGTVGSVRATAPAAGGVYAHYYEVAIATSDTLFVIAEIDSAFAIGDVSRPFLLQPTAPPDLAALRELNNAVSLWPPPTLTPEPDSMRSEGFAVDFVYYTSKPDFVWRIQPIIDWWSQWGWTSRVVVDSPDPATCKWTFRDYYEAAVAEDYWHLPMCIVVGEANQSDRPDCNVVGTYYVSDTIRNCKWEPCASDAALVDFYGNGPECPYTRVPACSIEELENCVQSTLEYYDGVNSTSTTVLSLAGDITAQCNVVEEPRLLMEEIAGLYADSGYAVTQLIESSYTCLDYSGRLARFRNEVNAGVREIIGTGALTDRGTLPGFFCQRWSPPACDAIDLTRLQRIVCEFPGCGMGDTDRNFAPNTGYPGLPKRFLVADPDHGTSSVGWVSNTRGGMEACHFKLARHYFAERLKLGHWSIQECYWKAVSDLWRTQPSMRGFLRYAAAYGFPVGAPGFLAPLAAPEGRKEAAKDGLRVLGSPGRASRLELTLLREASVDLMVFDVTGRRVRTLVGGATLGSGSHEIVWDGTNDRGNRCPRGVYFARLAVSGRQTRVETIVVR